jgi:peptidoglycan hydrolase CwlO-like protein
MSKYLIVVIILMAGAGYWYYGNTQERIKVLTENNAKLEVANKTNQETINTLQADAEKNAKLTKDLQSQLQTAEEYGDQLRNTLRKHNLTHLANKKPAAIEKRMQNATDRLWNCLADITDPNGVFTNAGTESSNCNKNSKNSSSSDATPKASSTK